MVLFRNWRYCLRTLSRREAVRSETDEELRAYIEMSAQEKVRDGMDLPAALRAARIQMGNIDAIKERIGDIGWESLIESVWRDVCYTVRMLLHSPGFATVAVLTLALGIGANTAVFSVLDAALLKSLPVRDPGRLVTVRAFEQTRDSIISYPVLRELSEGQQSFIGLAASSGPSRLSFRTSQGEPAQLVMGALVSANYFPVVGVDIAAGRGFLPQDDDQSSPAVAVISHRFWQRCFAGESSALGSAVIVNSTPVVIIGVASPKFQSDTFGIEEDFWLPLTKFRTADLQNRNGTFFAVLGRLRSQVTRTHAESELTSLYQRSRMSEVGLSGTRIEGNGTASNFRVDVDEAGARGLTILSGRFSRVLVLAMAFVFLVLLVACANIATLLLARAASRQHEIEVRLALGCSRVRLVRQLLTESTLLASLGAVVGVVLAYVGTQSLARSLTIGSIPIAVDLSPDVRVLGFVGAVSITFGILFGLAPALKSTSSDPHLARTAPIGGRPRQRLGKFLVTTQIALSLLLLVVAGLLVRSFQNLHDMDPGFDRENVIMAELHQDGDLPLSQFQSQLKERMSVIPGVRGVSFSWLPLLDQFTDLYAPILVSGYALNPNKPALARYDSVSAGYFQVIGIRLLAGRGFSEEDRADSPLVVVVNESFVREFLPGQEPLGKFLTIAIGDESHRQAREIVGVVKNVKYRDVRLPVKPLFYAPITQLPREIRSIEIRTSGPVNTAIVAPHIREVLRDIAPQLTLDDVVTASQQVERPITQERIIAGLSAGFGLLALFLACAGLYGLLSYAVIQRRAEIGIRLALGATRRGVLRLIIGESLMLIASGVIVGLFLALAATGVATNLLYGLSATDPITITLVTMLLILVAVLASILPAYRAAQLDPLAALRYE